LKVWNTLLNEFAPWKVVRGKRCQLATNRKRRRNKSCSRSRRSTDRRTR
jgi:hypothetical protein